jgi:hypothetical protein
VRVVAGAAQQQAAAEHEPACWRGGCGVYVPVRELIVWGRVCDGGACSRACAADGRGQREAGVV